MSRKRTPMRRVRRGFDAVKEVQKQQEGGNRGKIFPLFLREDEETEVVFLSDTPILFYEHTIKNGDKWDSVICTGGTEEGCSHCDDGEKARPKGALLVLDYREWEQTVYKDGKDTGKKRTLPFGLRLFARGMKDIQPLDIMNRRHGLLKWNWYLNRTGTGTQTSYSFDRGEETELTQEDWDDIETLLPFEVQGKLDVTDPEQMADLVEYVVNPSFKFEWMEDEKDTTKGKKSRKDEYEDDYDDDLEDIDDGVMDLEEEEEEKPTRPRRRTARVVEEEEEEEVPRRRRPVRRRTRR